MIRYKLMFAWLCLLNLTVTTTYAAEDAPPKSLDPRLKVELFAENPQIVTPTGIDVDHRGRVWVIESNTHHRNRVEEYQGHDSDRVLIFSGRDEKGRAEKITTFTDGLEFGMSIAVRPDGAVYVATRMEVLLFRDTDGDDKPDSREQILHLDTLGDYPHNGLGGFAFDALGWMYVGMGENLGADYKLIGSDGSSVSGGGEGGNVYRCRPDGSKLTRFATGFWNPHASCFDTFGRMFTVDNDPDSRPPCRLLHTIRGGDYGYRYRNGRRGVHPFTAWNGELPGTLPMVAGTGEAPSGIVAYESDGFPEEYIGSLLVGSWGDHRIDRFQLKPRGTSFTSKAEPLIVGGENFRPVGLAVAPDGSLYFSDWVLKDYPVHGKGRIWRVSAVKEPQREVLDTATIPGRPVDELTELLGSKRIEVRRAAAVELALTDDGRVKSSELLMNPRVSHRKKVELAWALGKTMSPRDFWKLLVKMNSAANEYGAEFTAAVETLNDANLKVEDWRLITGYGFDDETWSERLKVDPDDVDAKNIRTSRVCLPVFDNGFRWRGTTPTTDVDQTLLLSVLDWIDVYQYDTLPIDGDYLSDYSNFNFAFSMSDEFVFAKLLDVVHRSFKTRLLHKLVAPQATPHPRPRLGYFLALRRRAPKFKSAAESGLADPSSAIRRAAAQWIAEEDFQDLRPNLEQLLSDGEISTDLFEATLAALAILDGIERDGDFKTKIKDEIPGSQYVLQMVSDKTKKPALRARALRALDPANEALNEKLLTELLAVADPTLTLETVRTLQTSPMLTSARLLRSVASNEQLDLQTRAEAIAGLAAHPIDPASRELLTKLLTSEDQELRTEALRSLRKLPLQDFDQELKVALAGLSAPLIQKEDDKVTQQDRELAEQLVRTLIATGHDAAPKLQELQHNRPQTIDQWQQLLAKPGDPDAGRRVFFHSSGAGCYRCHTINGRGGNVGPDLSTIARTSQREKLVKSLLEPSADIAPQFSGWSFVMNNGKTHSGLILSQDHEGKIVIGESNGEILELDASEIEERIPQTTSIMPEKLVDQLTQREFRDLIAYLESLK